MYSNDFASLLSAAIVVVQAGVQHIVFVFYEWCVRCISVEEGVQVREGVVVCDCRSVSLLKASY